MPRTVGERDKLDERTITSNEKVSGYLQRHNRTEARMRARVQAIAEEPFDAFPPELAGRQADAVDDNHVDVAARRP